MNASTLSSTRSMITRSRRGAALLTFAAACFFAAAALGRESVRAWMILAGTTNALAAAAFVLRARRAEGADAPGDRRAS